MLRVGVDDPAVELVVGQAAGPAVENLQQRRRRPATCPSRYSIEASTSSVDQPREPLGIAIGPQPRRRLVRSSRAPDHVGRDGPRRAAKADQCRLVRQILARIANRLGRRSRTSARRRRSTSAIDVGRGLQMDRAWSFAFDEAHRLAERVGHDEDVGEQDRGVEAVAADRLQRHLGGQRRRVAQVRGSCRPWRASRGTPADSGRPAASARSAAERSLSPANGCRKRIVCALARVGLSNSVMPSLSNLESRDLFYFDSYQGGGLWESFVVTARPSPGCSAWRELQY